MSSDLSTPLDALAPTVAGRYEDSLVLVEAHDAATGTPGAGTAPGTVRTTHFEVSARDGRLVVHHRVSAEQVDDDLAGLLQDELFGPGWLRGVDLFERIFTGVVRTSHPDPLGSWELFYRNTLRRLSDVDGRCGTAPAGAPAITGAPVGTGSDSAPEAHGSIRAYAPVYAHAWHLLAPGSVLEVGCCFGFLSLLLAGSGRETTASDVSAGTVRLLAEIAPRLGVGVRTVTADAARCPAPDASADNVLVVHLLEHLDARHGAQALTEALRLARRRVIVAVPFEAEANETYGQVRTVSLDDLQRWGRSSGRAFDAHEFHGGWLVLDR